MTNYKVISDITKVREEPLSIKGAVGVYTQWLVSRDDGSKYAVRRQVVKPGGKAPLHRHAYAETFIVLRGVGRMTVEDETIDVKPGMCIFVKPNTPHSITNTSNEDLELITIISYEEDMSINVLE
ncbi:cupin domain-containing protein [Vulcanisaeta distributa]|uniref:Cupin 2 conserved barrel domain protein n=1 Tax=Vulcanisaeta distributa (strain DSM 14429 / JCM 11212 / NBRC 100878 / IC-017) TaxID=572478 RepID=E1QTG4_VULDI|nr:cupin domain-containing protein [Vulcanisaeta distributa]ADN50957.1 Cupin 2 conserved barrel domain protein [Vulcanisaeta distributa DSM 14429]